MTPEEVEEFVQEVDVNGDGEIDYDEFIQIIDAKAGSKAQVIRKEGTNSRATEGRRRAVTTTYRR